MRRADRLFQIIEHLRVQACVTARQLAQRLEVSEGTIYRDVQDLMTLTVRCRDKKQQQRPSRFVSAVRCALLLFLVAAPYGQRRVSARARLDGLADEVHRAPQLVVVVVR